MTGTKERQGLCFKVSYFETVDSTNISAVGMAQRGAGAGSVVVANRQIQGKGRMGRVWRSPAEGGLWFSIIIRPVIEPEYAAQVTLLAAVAVVKALLSVVSGNFAIKWPNDVMLGDKKICGILTEVGSDKDGEVEYVVIGIGLNVNMEPDDFGEDIAGRATSLLMATGRRHSKDSVLNAVLSEFRTLYHEWQDEGFDNIRSQWLEHNGTLGREVVILDDGREVFAGTAAAIDDCGNLEVRGGDGATKVFDFGEVSICSGGRRAPDELQVC